MVQDKSVEGVEGRDWLREKDRKGKGKDGKGMGLMEVVCP